MSPDATWDHLTADGRRFETFCHEAMSTPQVLKGRARTNYRPAESDDSPYDGETNGEYRGHTGRILFEYKCGSRASEILKDLLEPSAGGTGDKLCRARRLRPDAVAYVLVLGKAGMRSAAVDRVRAFIEAHGLGFAFEIERPQTVRGWLKALPHLELRFRPPAEDRTLGEFLKTLEERLRPQGGSVNFPQYSKLDQLYVEPREFEKAFGILQKKRIVLLVGPPHVGKTFTAVYLLWHFFKVSEREPRWILPKPLEAEPGPGASVPQVKRPHQSLAALVAENVGPHKVTYVEDPFGKTSDEEVRWDYPDPGAILSEIVQYVQRDAKDAQVVITSRERVLDQALSKQPKLRELVVRLKGSVRLGTGSYTKEQKRELLRRYASLHGCRWAAGDIPADAYDAAAKLPTPHAIAYYCDLAAASATPAARWKCFRKASQELVKAFAGEIARLDETPLAALLTAELFEPSPELFARAFPRLAGANPVETWAAAMKALSDFARVGEYGWRLTYVHPSYAEATRLVLKRDVRVRAIFREACNSLAKDSELRVRGAAAWWLGLSWKDLDAEGRAVLGGLAKDPEAGVRKEAAQALGDNWRDLDAGGRALLVGLAKDSEASVRGAAVGALHKRDAVGR
jgi:hypothetical protein